MNDRSNRMYQNTSGYCDRSLPIGMNIGNWFNERLVERRNHD